MKKASVGEENSMNIKTLKREDEKYILQAAQLLVDGFKKDWPKSWPNL